MMLTHAVTMITFCLCADSPGDLQALLPGGGAHPLHRDGAALRGPQLGDTHLRRHPVILGEKHFKYHNFQIGNQ